MTINVAEVSRFMIAPVYACPMARMVPVFLCPDKKRKIVVFGGGDVALRKCRQFDGFRIMVVAERIVSGIREVCDEVVCERFDPSDISAYINGAFIAVAATDSKELNAAIAASAKAAGILVNSAHGGGDVLLPSSVRKNGYTVSVSSEGSVPAFPPYVAKKIDEFLGDEYDLMLDLLKEIRKEIRTRVKEQSDRAKLLADILNDDDIWHMLEVKDTDGALDAAERIEKTYESL